MSTFDMPVDTPAGYDSGYTFRLTRKISPTKATMPPLHSATPFPWSNRSLLVLWGGSLWSTDLQDQWEHMIAQYTGAIALASEKSVIVVLSDQNKSIMHLRLPNQASGHALQADHIQVAWSLDHHAPLQPILIISYLRLVFIVNLHNQQVVGTLRGHGGNITFIGVHPTMPHLFCTTSRDFTTRVYDLTLEPQDVPYNPPWPPIRQPSQAGAAHGLHASEIEGNGIGRCIGVLLGGRSGGHQAAVLGAAFHHSLPVIATCGMDHTVKIWYFHPMSSHSMLREDKPLFSSSQIHKASVLSVNWLSDDTLISHSAPVLMAQKTEDFKSTQFDVDPAEAIIWRWLALNRFFPADQNQNNDYPMFLRGCSSDYQESSSFKIISAMTFPHAPTQYLVPQVFVTQDSSRGPLLAFTHQGSTSIDVVTITAMAPRTHPTYSLQHSNENEGGVAATVKWPPQGTPTHTKIMLPEDEPNTLSGCAIAMAGTLIAGVGDNGTLWIWRQV